MAKLTETKEQDIKNEILGALQQIDETFSIETFECDVYDRSLYVQFTAKNENGETVEIDTELK